MVVKQMHKFGTLAVLLLFSFQVAVAQNKIITGKITDSKDSSALQNVSILAKGTERQRDSKCKNTFSIRLCTLILTWYKSWILT